MAQSPTAPRNGLPSRGLALPARPVADAAHEHVDARVTSVKSFDIRNRIDPFGVEEIRCGAG